MAEAKEKIAVVTGAGTGVGRAASLALMNAGFTVVLAGRRMEMLEETKKLGDNIGKSLCVSADMTSPASIAALFAKVMENYGRLDVLFNNAGGSTSADGPLTVAPLEEFWRALKLDLFGTWLCSRSAIPLMQRSGGGSIVNSASIVAEMGIPNRDAYTASKGGVVALTRSMAVEFARDNIRVNVVIPGAVGTPRVLGFFEREPHLKKQWDAYLLGIADPIDVANAVLFLASDESRRTTGQKLPVDSGILIS